MLARWGVTLPNYEEDVKLLKILVALFQQRNTCAWCWQRDRLVAATGHHLEDVMATCHPSSVPGEVAGKIIQHQCLSDGSGRNKVGTSPAVCS